MNQILKFSSIIYAFLIFISYSYLDFYYSFFNIDIFPFLNFSEILIAFLNISNTLVIFLLVLFLYISFLLSISTIIPTHPIEKLAKKTKKMEIGFNILSLVISIFLVIYSGYQLISLIMNTWKDFEDRINMGYFYIIIFMFILFVIIYFAAKTFRINLTLKYSFVPFGIMVYLMFLYHAYADYEKHIRRIKNEEISFEYNGLKYFTNDSLIYIGSTKDYLFLNSLSDNVSYVFNKENIESLKVFSKSKIGIKK